MSHGVNLISAASCTTTGLAHAVKPFVGNGETAGIITASMSTIHATTGNQNILLDAVPQAGVSDLRKNRQVFNNIILTTTGAAIALEEILPEIRHIGFMADAVRIPTSTASLITLNVTFRPGTVYQKMVQLFSEQLGGSLFLSPAACPSANRAKNRGIRVTVIKAFGLPRLTRCNWGHIVDALTLNSYTDVG
ncbi:MAG: hypothetical protein GYA86_07850 [Firmicutes bacterium]|nr:hypothetical protein [Bacillota bacterium]